jgi:hypothetical protein
MHVYKAAKRCLKAIRKDKGLIKDEISVFIWHHFGVHIYKRQLDATHVVKASLKKKIYLTL